MKLGIIGAEDSVAWVMNIVTKKMKYIELFPMFYTSYPEAVHLLDEKQKSLNAVLFTGVSIYTYVSRHLKPLIPWDFPAITTPELACTLLLIEREGYYDIGRISFDACYNRDLLTEAYGAIGYDFSTLSGVCISDEMYRHEDDYSTYLYEYHRRKFLSGETSCCVVGNSAAYRQLKQEDIPCIRRTRFSEQYLEKITMLMLRHQLAQRATDEFVVVALEVQLHEDYSISGKGELELLSRKTRVSELVHFLAHRLGGTAVAGENGKFYVFCVRSQTQNPGNFVKNFDILAPLTGSKVADRTFIGVGISDSIEDARLNAERARLMSKVSPADCLYISGPGSNSSGPIFLKTAGSESASASDEIDRISEKTGLSVKTLSRLQQIFKVRGSCSQTPADLASLYGISPRSMNRILQKLESAGCLRITGQEDHHRTGRPSRKVQILF